MNQVSLIGRTVKDLELRQTANGKSFCFFTIAVNENYGMEQQTHFILCIAWEKQAENLVKYVKKGNQIAVEGSLNVRQDNNNGQFTTITTVKVARTHFLSSTTSENKSSGNNVDLGKNWHEAQTNEGYKLKTQQAKQELFADDEVIEW